MSSEPSDVVLRMADRMNAHDLDGMVAHMHPDYRSEQPFHPDRDFVGRAQMKANWGALLTGIPDMRCEVLRSTQDGTTAWSEWHWWGTLESGDPFELRGVTLFEVVDGLITAGRLYTEQVQREGAGIDAAVEASSGVRPVLDDE
jgi:ketosteroid isomerase-like protein